MTKLERALRLTTIYDRPVGDILAAMQRYNSEHFAFWADINWEGIDLNPYLPRIIFEKKSYLLK